MGWPPQSRPRPRAPTCYGTCVVDVDFRLARLEVCQPMRNGSLNARPPGADLWYAIDPTARSFPDGRLAERGGIAHLVYPDARSNPDWSWSGLDGAVTCAGDLNQRDFIQHGYPLQRTRAKWLDIHGVWRDGHDSLALRSSSGKAWAWVTTSTRVKTTAKGQVGTEVTGPETSSRRWSLTTPLAQQRPSADQTGADLQKGLRGRDGTVRHDHVLPVRADLRPVLRRRRNGVRPALG